MIDVENSTYQDRAEGMSMEVRTYEPREPGLLVWSDRARRDARLALRSLWRSRGFTLAAIATLALGIGANTAIFSTVYAVLLKPLPYQHPEQLYSVEITIPQRAAAIGALSGRIQDYLEWRDARTSFAGVATMTPVQWNLTGTGEPERVGGALV
jgi:putative ABC transport system permease protein